MLAGTTLTKMEKAWVAFGAVPLAAVIVPENVPEAVGVPEMRPPELMVRPLGSPGAVKVIGVVPLAVHV